MAADELEAQLLDLQEEFQKLQEGTARVEDRQERQIHELKVSLATLNKNYETLALERSTLKDKLLEREDEIRYLQVELEAALFDRQQQEQEQQVSKSRVTRNDSFAAIAFIKKTLEGLERVADEANF